MASVASSSSGYGPFDSDGPDSNGPLHADPMKGENEWEVKLGKLVFRLPLDYGPLGHSFPIYFTHRLSLVAHEFNLAHLL